MKIAASRDEIGDFDSADLDDAMAVRRIEPRGFSIENDLAHSSSEPR
jgi:hypothetical protein